MNRETNLYLRSILGREKCALTADLSNLPKSPKEAFEKLAQIDEKIKFINEGLNLLKRLPDEPTATVEPPVEAPAPRLSDDTANRIRGVLELNVAASRDAASKVDALLFLLPDDKRLIQARLHGVKLLEQGLQDLHEFNEVYPKK